MISNWILQPRTLGLFILLALTACASDIKRVDISQTANPQEEVTKFGKEISAAQAADDDVLAAKEFRGASERYEAAQKELRNSESQKVILEEVALGRGYLKRSTELSDGRRSTMQGILDARKAASSAGALNFPAQKEQMKDLDQRLQALVVQTPFSNEDFNQLQIDYWNLETTAIQSTQLNTARAKVDGARRQGAADKVPNVLKKAELEITSANNLIAANRHNPEAFAEGVAKANAAADFAVDVLATAKRGNTAVSEDVAVSIVRQNRQINGLKDELGKSRETEKTLNNEVSQGQVQLSQSEAAQRLEKALEAARAGFKKEEADVYRQGDNLLIRLKTIGFATGRSDLPAQALPLLAKVKMIAQDLNPRQVTVEGHTDSTGERGANLVLSQSRADAVAQYLQTSGLSAGKIEAVGHGDQAPLANNKSKIGRAQNRRVDVIVTPSETLTQ